MNNKTHITKVADAIWSIHGENLYPGLHFTIVGGVHGNEKTGIHVVKRLLRAFKAGRLKMRRGVLTLAIGNPLAARQSARFSYEGVDLNRCFTKKVLNGWGWLYEQKRARELAEALRHTDVGLDLHATLKPSKPFLFMSSRSSANLADFHPNILLTDPNRVFAGEPCTLDEYLHSGRGTGICYETGQADDTSRAQQVYHEVLNYLAGWIEGTPLQRAIKHRTYRTAGELETKRHALKTYTLMNAVRLSSCGFRFADGMGTHNLQPVQAGQIIGYHADQPEVASEDGVLVFPKVAELWRTGEPVVYLAKRAEQSK